MNVENNKFNMKNKKTTTLLNLLIIVISYLSSFAYGQNLCGTNLIPNHDLESIDATLCADPTWANHQLWIDQSPVIDWYGTTTKNGPSSGITPDHYDDQCSAGNSGVACMGGYSSVGVFTSTNAGGSSGSQTREYVQCQLLSPLVAGRTYYIEMKVSSNNNNTYTDGFGAWFFQSTGPYNGDGLPQFIVTTPQFENPTGNIINNSCQVISGYFCATGGENWMMLGNFKNDADLIVDPTSSGISYVVVDNINVQEVCPGDNPDLISLTTNLNPVTCGEYAVIEGTIVTPTFGTITYNWLSPSSLVGNTTLGPFTQQLTMNTNYILEYDAAGPCGNFTDTVILSIDVNSGVIITQNTLTNETCLGDCDGSIDVSVSGGTTPYTSNWYNQTGTSIGSATTINSLCSGVYTYNVSSNETYQQVDTIFVEDFESSLVGWALNTNPSGGTNATNNNYWETSNEAIGESSPSPCSPSSDATLNLKCAVSCFGTKQFSNVATSRMAESPSINATNYTNLVVEFDYLGESSGTDAQGSLYYYDGSTWTFLTNLTSPICWGSYNSWTNLSVNLPASLNNNPNVKIGFQWNNTNSGSLIMKKWGLALNNVQVRGERPIAVICVEIDTFTIAGISCACTPPTLSTTPLSACSPSTVNLQSAVTTSSVSGTPVLNYYLNQSDADAAINSISSTISVSGTYYVRSQDPITSTCYSTASIVVTINSQPSVPTASVTVQPTCPQPTGTIVITAPTGASIQYSNGGAYQTSGTFSGLSPATYSLTAQDMTTGCISSVTTLIVNAVPSPPNAPTASVTVQPTCTTPTGTIVITAPTGGSIQYSNGGAYQASGTFSGLSPGTYSLTAQDMTTGCISSITTLNVNTVPSPPNAPTASVTVQPTCTTPTGTIVITAPTGASIQYSNGGAYQASGTFSGLSPGTYSITAQDMTTGCISSITTLTVNAVPSSPSTPVGTVTIQPTCASPTGTIEITNPTGTSIEYSIGGAYQSSTTFTGLTPNTYNVTAQDNITGCISSSTVLVVNNPPAQPIVSVSSPSTIDAGSSVTLTAGGANTYSWSPSTGLNSTTGSSVEASPVISTTYCVVGVDLNGCSDTACVQISVNCATLFVPNVFSPNGNSLDDDLCLYGMGCINELDFKIFNRWGELIFQTTDVNACWDGKYKDIIVSSGVYAYAINAVSIDGVILTKSGTITILK